MNFPLRRNRPFYHGNERIGVGSRKRTTAWKSTTRTHQSPKRSAPTLGAWARKRRREDAIAEAQQLEERRASYRRASVAATETPAFEDDSH